MLGFCKIIKRELSWFTTCLAGVRIMQPVALHIFKGILEMHYLLEGHGKKRVDNITGMEAITVMAW